MKPKISYVQAILVVGASFELLRQDQGYLARAYFRDVTEEKDMVATASGLRRSKAIGLALAHLGFSKAGERLINCPEWRSMAAILDTENYQDFSLVLAREASGAFHVVLSRGDERIRAAANTPLEAIEIAVADATLQIPKAFSKNEPVIETLLVFQPQTTKVVSTAQNPPTITLP